MFDGRLCLVTIGLQSGAVELLMMKEHEVKSSWPNLYHLGHAKWFQYAGFTVPQRCIECGLEDEVIVLIYDKRCIESLISPHVYIPI